MRFEEVVRRSVYGTTGFIAHASDLESIEAVIHHNLPILRLFRGIVVAANFGRDDRPRLSAAHAELWRDHLPDCVLVDNRVNRGHSIGTLDLDGLLFQHCVTSGIPWLCKGADDVLLSSDLLDIPVGQASFYFLNALSYDAVRRNGGDVTPFLDGFLFPQTTFYAIEVGAVDMLVDPDFLDRSYEAVCAIPHYNDRIWEHLPGWSCERLLRDTVLRNDLRRCSLATDEQWRRIVDRVVEHRIMDCSFKGIDVNGICHLDAASGVTEPTWSVR